MLEEKEQEIQESTTESEALEANVEQKNAKQEVDLPKETDTVATKESNGELGQEKSRS